jgi:hypothetical protein
MTLYLSQKSAILEFQQGQWPAETIFLRTFSYKIMKQFKNFMRNFSGAMDNAEIISAGSLTSPQQFQRGHWQRW